MEETGYLESAKASVHKTQVTTGRASGLRVLKSNKITVDSIQHKKNSNRAGKNSTLNLSQVSKLKASR